MYPCACCGYLTMGFPEGSFDICDVCGWVDDNVGLKDPDHARGPNRVSLNDARANYARIGVSDPRKAGRVRPPRPNEVPDNGGTAGRSRQDSPVSPPQ